MKVFKGGYVYNSQSKSFRKADILCDDNGIISAVGFFEIPHGAEEILHGEGIKVPGNCNGKPLSF